MTRKLFTVAQAAEYLGRTPKAIERMAEKGLLPTVRLDRRVQFDIYDLDMAIRDAKRGAA